ncbi:MAG: hypothetical protein ACKVQC_09700 [Elusimicrobiota bacterium]
MRSSIYAEAMKEYIGDIGLYSVLPFSEGTFSGSGIQLDYVKVVTGIDAPAPEGVTVTSITVNSWGGIFYMNSTGYGNFLVQLRDFSDYSGGTVRFWLKSTESLRLGIEHGAPIVTNFVDIPTTNGLWQEINIPLANFNNAGGVNLTQIRSPYVFSRTNGGAVTPTTFLIDHMRWTKPINSLVIFPSATTVNPGKKRQFTVEGRAAGLPNDPIYLYSDFSVPGAVGTVNPSTRVMASTFTANTNSGSLTSSFGAANITAALTINNSNLNQELGLLSETIANSIVIETDSKLLSAFGGLGVSAPTLLDESSTDVREGVKRFKTTINSDNTSTAASFSGWFIQWSTSASDAITRDMNRYYDGSLRFWLKAPAALNNKLIVGVRSGNTPAGAELSKVNLSNYVTFDDTWRSVVVPIKDLAGPRPWADISRTKLLFSIFAIGNISSAQTFYIDNLRWDTAQPGPLTHFIINPSSITVPFGSLRSFYAVGKDANGVTVDAFPTWSVTGGIGSVNPTQGLSTLLTSVNVPASGSVRATQGAIISSAPVTVATITWTQSLNVYSDLGSGGYVGVAQGSNPGTVMGLNEQNDPGSPEGVTYRRATFNLVNNSGLQDAFAVWFTNVDGASGTRFMRFYESGYLTFWVKTSYDLQVAIRSGNIAPGAERSKIRLSEIGIPLNNTWQRVFIALSEFKAKEPLLDFDQIQTYFAVGALSSQIGPVVGGEFGIDDVKFLTSDGGFPDPEKVYVGLKELQEPTGLVRSFKNLPRAVTYDEALAGMAMTYKRDTLLAKKIFDVYKGIHDSGVIGFHNEYTVSSTASSFGIINGERSVGPNAWMLLALLHYRNVTNQSTYDTVIDSLASFIAGLRDTDGSVFFGRTSGGVLMTNKATEHQLDVYATFKAYAKFRNNNTYNIYADQIKTWLETQMYIPAENRFRVGKYSSGANNNDRGLDCYSWAPLTLSSYTVVLSQAETDFLNTKPADLTGVPVTGFDFSGPYVNPPGTPAPVDKDAVWLEGTAQMAVAFYATDNKAKGDQYLNEILKAVINTSPNGQGLAYATNVGTAYGFMMDPSNQAASSAAWLMFAYWKFNPFNVYPITRTKLLNVNNLVETSTITWSVASLPTSWVRAQQMLVLDVQPITDDPSWGIQIYTDNTNPSFSPRYVDPTPGNTSNLDSDPSGLIRDQAGQPTTSNKLNVAWSIKDSTSAIPSANSPYDNTPNSFQWLIMKDRQTPNIPDFGITAFQDGSNDVVLRKALGSHTSQGNGFSGTLTPDYVYFEADFSMAFPQTLYRSNFILEFFIQ